VLLPITVEVATSSATADYQTGVGSYWDIQSPGMFENYKCDRDVSKTRKSMENSEHISKYASSTVTSGSVLEDTSSASTSGHSSSLSATECGMATCDWSDTGTFVGDMEVGGHLLAYCH
jgi:hypothetical protein